MFKHITILFLFSFISLQANNDIKVCYLEWGKLGGKELPNYGLIPDVVATTLKEAGYTPKVDILPWARCLKLVELKRYDLVAGFWIGEEQKRTYTYLEPNTVDDIAFISLDDLKVKSGNIENFYDKKVALIRDAGGLENFYKDENRFQKVIRVNNDIQMIELLKAKRIDAIISDPVQILSLVDNRFPKLKEKLKVWNPPIQRNIGAPAIANDHPKKDEIIQKYNETFIKLRDNGLYDHMMKKHNVILKYKE